MEVCKCVLSIYRHMIMEHTMNTQTWCVEISPDHGVRCEESWWLTCCVCREQMLQVLLRVTEAVMKRPQENQRKDSFAESLASILFRVSPQLAAHLITRREYVQL